MIEDLDEALRQLIIRELPIKNSEVDVKFEQPKREWSARLSRPTLNFFLFNVHENTKLRQPTPLWDVVERRADGSLVQRRQPARVDLHYMITAWAADPGDEHRLLARTMMALFRTPFLPADLLPESLQKQPAPIQVLAAQPEGLQNMADVWNALDNEMRPAVSCVITIALDPYRDITGPPVRTRELRMGLAVPPTPQQLLDEEAGIDVFWTVGGTVRSKKPLENPRLLFVRAGMDVPIGPEGHYTIGNLKAGKITLELSAEGREPTRFEITVPSEDYDLVVK